MENLLDLINELADKYNFDKADVDRLQKAIFDVEVGEDPVLGDEDVEDFLEPDPDEDGLSGEV